MIHHFINKFLVLYSFSLTFYQFLYPCPFLLQVIGGDLQERLIPVPYSKSTTDQAVREIQYFCIVVQNPFSFLYYSFLKHTDLCIIQCIFLYGCAENLYASFTNFFYPLISSYISATNSKNSRY